MSDCEREEDRDSQLQSVWRAIHKLFERTNDLRGRVIRLEASQQQNQASIDADTAAVSAVTAEQQQIQAEIDALKAQPGAQALDFSALDAAVAASKSQADTDLADAAPPASPPTPADPTPPAA